MGGNAFASFPSAVGGVGGWVELARTKLVSASNTITVSSLADKRYYMILCDGETTQTNGDHSWRFNGISTTTYARRRSTNGASDFVQTSVTFIQPLGTTNGQPFFDVGYIANLSAKEKLMQGHGIQANSAGAGDPMTRAEYAGKHAQTSNPIDEIQAVLTNGTPNYVTDSEVVVLGWDPADVHTNNFWEELASANLSGGASDTLDSGAFSSNRKYLWIQGYLEGANTEVQFRVNGLSTSIYSSRRSADGGADSTFLNQTQSKINASGGAAFTKHFVNIFIINISATEKLCISNMVSTEAAGAGTAPRRAEATTKVALTSGLISSFQFINVSSGDLGTLSEIKVWGSD